MAVTMLRELSIRNLAVVEEAVVPFAPGLNVLTGETGAGKSIVVDALLLITGARAQLDWIRTGANSRKIVASRSSRSAACRPRGRSGAAAATETAAAAKTAAAGSPHCRWRLCTQGGQRAAR